jgi:hypothetical protein
MDEDQEVDIHTIPKDPDFSSDEENDVFFLPTYPIPDNFTPLITSTSSQGISFTQQNTTNKQTKGVVENFSL